tara:strand:- start:5304 stop:7112 length:1809 start_codon:yes stop_codon:yes gene_type:complete
MKKTLPWLFLIIGIIISTLVWNFISLPYNTSNTIIGQYSLNEFNPLNDTLRGLFFIFFPLLLYFVLFLKYNNELINSKIFQSESINSNKNINILCFILILFSILEFCTLNHQDFLGNLDVHHEGTFLSAQLNFFDKKGIWSSTFFDYGFLGNSIGIFFNFIFDDYSIGIQRFSLKFLILFNKVLIIFICRKIVNCLHHSNQKEILFLIFGLSSLTLANFYENVTPLHSRIFIYLIFTLLVFEILTSKKNNIFVLYLTGFFSLLALMFYWDIGTYVNVLLFLVLIYLILLKKFNDFYNILLSIFFSWFIFYILLPNDEFKEFINQYIVILNISDYLIGIEFPQPFSDKSTRHTKALLLIIFSGVFLINYIFDNFKKESLESKVLLIFIFVSSIIFFKSGLMRSDGPHIKYSSALYTLLIFFFVAYYFLNAINKLQFFKKINFFLQNRKYLFLLSIMICFLFIFQKNYLNFFNFLDSNKNFLMITKVDDKEFLEEDYYKFLQLYKKLIKDEKCVQQFTDDNAIPYLVNKPTCTKYYVSAHIIQNWTEDDFIKELKYSKPNYIVYSSKINWFKNRKNAPNADIFIINNYFLYEDLSPWKIYKKNY